MYELQPGSIAWRYIWLHCATDHAPDYFRSSGSSSQSVMRNTGFHCRTRQNWNKCHRPSRSVPPLTERPETPEMVADPKRKRITANSQEKFHEIPWYCYGKKGRLDEALKISKYSSTVQYGCITRLLPNLSMPGLFEVRLILCSHHEEGKHCSETNSKAQHCESLIRTNGCQRKLEPE